MPNAKENKSIKTNEWINREISNYKNLTKEDLELNNSGQWPVSLKSISLILLFFSLIYINYWLILNDTKEKLGSAEVKQEQLIQEFKILAYKIATLPNYQQQITNLQNSLAEQLDFIPQENNLPLLLDTVQQVANQLQLEIIQLNLMPKQAYQQLIYTPIILEVKGSYHKLASYLSNISNLNNLITLHNFQLLPETQVDSKLKLLIEARAYQQAEG